MSVELAELLIQGGLVPLQQVEAALLHAFQRRRSFVLTLVTQSPETERLLLAELGRLGLPQAAEPRLALDWALCLPAGLCETLAAVPIEAEDPERVVVAVADPLDPHVAEEFSFHLGAEVKPLQAPPTAILEALQQLAAETCSPPFSRSQGTTGSQREGLAREPESSWPPIPLIRRSMAPCRSETDRTEPLERPARPPRAVHAAESALDLDPEQGLEPALDLLEWATAPSDVVAALVEGLLPAAGTILVFSAAGGAYVGRAGNEAAGTPDLITRIRVPAGETVFDLAMRRGVFLGPLPDTAGHDPVAAVVGASAEILVLPVFVSHRAALFVVLGGMGSTGLAARRAERLSQAAGEALQRIVRLRKEHG